MTSMDCKTCLRKKRLRLERETRLSASARTVAIEGGEQKSSFLTQGLRGMSKQQKVNSTKKDKTQAINLVGGSWKSRYLGFQSSESSWLDLKNYFQLTWR